MTKAPTRTPERVALAEAIQRRDEAHRAAEMAKAALADFMSKRSETTAEWADAEAAREKAEARCRELYTMLGGSKAEVTKHCVLHGQEDPDTQIARTTREVADARERLDLANEGRRRLEAEVSITAEQFTSAEGKVTTAILPVLKTAIPKLLDIMEGIERTYFGTRLVLTDMSDAFPKLYWHSHNRSDDPIGDVERRYRRAVERPDLEIVKEATDPWDAARASLRHDPDAVLPL